MLIQLLLIQIITFVGIILILRFLFYRHLSAALKRIKKLHEQTLTKEIQLKEELDKAEAERLAEIEKGKQEAEEIVKSARKEAEALRSNSQEQAKQEAEKILARGKEELKRLKANLLSEIENQAINLSIEILKYTFTEEGKANLQHQLIDEVIQQIKAVEEDKFSVKANKVKIISSFPLTDGERQNLKEVLSSKMKSDLSFEEKIDPALITGLVVEIGALVIDGSLKSKLRRVIPYLKR